MPEWLEAIRTEVPDHQLKEFREVLRYIQSTSLKCCCYSCNKDNCTCVQVIKCSYTLLISKLNVI